ncbi:MAG: histone deacetylase family protein, partial [Burkholderiaceae bacterium]
MHFYSHPRFQDHSMGSGHPECPERLVAIEETLKARALWPQLDHQVAKSVDIGLLELAHAKDLLQRLTLPVAQGSYEFIDPDTCMNAHTYEAMLLASGAVLQAVDAVLAGETRHAFCAVRPPGHHAERSSSMGFCFVNHIALAALYAREKHKLTRVAVIDFDVHHGNGTEDILANEEGVLMVSSFQQGIYPGSGTRPRGSNMVNIPLQAGADSAAIGSMLKNHWIPQLEAFEPQLLLISAGFDAHREDPLAGLAWTEDDYEQITDALVQVTDTFCPGRIVSSLEGGYCLDALGRSVS